MYICCLGFKISFFRVFFSFKILSDASSSLHIKYQTAYKQPSYLTFIEVHLLKVEDYYHFHNTTTTATTTTHNHDNNINNDVSEFSYKLYILKYEIYKHGRKGCAEVKCEQTHIKKTDLRTSLHNFFHYNFSFYSQL